MGDAVRRESKTGLGRFRRHCCWRQADSTVPPPMGQPRSARVSIVHASGMDAEVLFARAGSPYPAPRQGAASLQGAAAPVSLFRVATGVVGFPPIEAGRLGPLDARLPHRCPQMLAGMMEVQQLVRVGPAILDHTPDPRRSIGQGQYRSSPSQSPGAWRFPVQAPPNFQGLALPAHHYFVQQSPRCEPHRLFLRIKHPQLLFMPFYAGLRGFLLPPTGPSKTHQISIQQQYPQIRRGPLGETFPPELLESLPGLGQFQPGHPTVAPRPRGSNLPPDIPPWPPTLPPLHTNRLPSQTYASLSSNAGLSCWWGDQTPSLAHRTSPGFRSLLGFCPYHTSNPIGPRPSADASAAVGDATPCVRSGGKTPPWRSASACTFSANRRRIHSRPSASTSNSNSRNVRTLLPSKLIGILSLNVWFLIG